MVHIAGVKFWTESLQHGIDGLSWSAANPRIFTPGYSMVPYKHVSVTNSSSYMIQLTSVRSLFCPLVFSITGGLGFTATVSIQETGVADSGHAGAAIHQNIILTLLLIELLISSAGVPTGHTSPGLPRLHTFQRAVNG